MSEFCSSACCWFLACGCFILFFSMVLGCTVEMCCGLVILGFKFHFYWDVKLMHTSAAEFIASKACKKLLWWKLKECLLKSQWLSCLPFMAYVYLKPRQFSEKTAQHTYTVWEQHAICIICVFVIQILLSEWFKQVFHDKTVGFCSYTGQSTGIILSWTVLSTT